MKLFLSGILTFFFFGTYISSGTTLHLKPGPVDGKDAYLSSNDPNTVYSNHQEFSGDAWTCGGNPCFGRGLLQFDLSSIPIGASIISATVSFYANQSPNNGGGISMQGNNQALLQRVTSSWDESTVNWNNAPSITVQNEVILNQSVSQFQDYINIDVKQIVQDMVNDPSNSFGFLLQLFSEVPFATMIFASSDYPDSMLWPEITIEYIESNCLELSLDHGTGGDVYLSSNAPSTNFGNHLELSGDAWTCGGNPCFGRGLFSFDLSTIPTNVQITSAKLNLYANPNPTNGGGIAMQGNNSSVIQRVTSAWSENTATWNTAPSATNQNEVVLPQSTSSYEDYLNIDVNDLISDMVSSPNSSWGFMIRLIDEIPFASMIFASKDYPDTSKRPKLTVCYSNFIGINEFENEEHRIEIFPNPYKNKFKIKFDLINSTDINLEILDVLGKVVYSENKGFLNAGSHMLEIETGDELLKRGIYFLRLSNNKQFIISKLIKH